MPPPRKKLVGWWLPDHPRKRIIHVLHDDGILVTYGVLHATGPKIRTVKRAAVIRWIRKHNASVELDQPNP